MPQNRLNILKKYGISTIILLLVSVPLFKDLGDQPLRMWDESRRGVNAYEMVHNHQWFTTYYGEKPDMWNTKPTMLLWFQVLSMKLFGMNEFALRFPSALAALITIAILLLFVAKKTHSDVLFIIMSLILITTQGYVGHHVTRTGDYDALLILFTTLFSICFYLFIDTRENRYIYLTFVFISLAVLTKSIVGLMFLPGLFLFALLKRQLLNILKNRHFYFGLLLFAVVVIGYYLTREWQNPGYLKALYANELGGRYLEALEQEQKHYGILFYYYQIFIQFAPWYVLAGAGLLIGLFSGNEKIRDLTILFTLNTVIFFAVISTAETKHPWYLAPVMPFLAFLAAVPLNYIYEHLSKKSGLSEGFWNKYIPVFFLILVFFIPYKKILSSFENTEEQIENGAFYHMSQFLRENGDQIPDSTIIVYDAQTLAHIHFYMNKLREDGVDLSLYTFPVMDSCRSVLVGQDFFHDLIHDHYKYDILEDHGKVKRYSLLGRNDSEMPFKTEFKEEFSNIHVYTYDSVDSE